MRKLAAFGMVVVGLMQVVFALLGADRGFPYREVQILAFVASLALAWGIATWNPIAMSAGFGVNALARVAQPVLGLTRLPLWLNVILSIGWILGAVHAARGRDLRIALWILGVAYALSVFTAFGRFGAAVALTLTAAGLFLAAPNAHR